MKKTTLQMLPAKELITLKRNPQYLTPKQMESLKSSIKRDGFCVPVLVRPIEDDRYEIISGNHRVMAAKEIGVENIPCVLSDMTDSDAMRLAVNLNTIHGEPNPELLAPFLAELDEQTLAQIHVEKDMMEELKKFDEHLADVLSNLDVPEKINTNSPTHSNNVCTCPTCGRKHMAAE